MDFLTKELNQIKGGLSGRQIAKLIEAHIQLTALKEFDVSNASQIRTSEGRALYNAYVQQKQTEVIALICADFETLYNTHRS